MTGHFPTAPPPESSLFKPSEHVGALIRVFVTDYAPQAETPFGVRAEALVDVDVIEDPNGGAAGEHYDALRWSGKMLAPQLGAVVGGEVFGRLAAWPGRNANPAIYLDVLKAGDDRLIEAWKADQQAHRVTMPEVGRGAPEASRYNQHPPRGSMPPQYPPNRPMADGDVAPF
jgi:hypothetical protein